MFIIEGNIGAGKSTFLKKIQQAVPDIMVHQEPVDGWQQQQHGQSLLQSFYEDTKRWAYTFETWTLMQRVHEYVQLQQQPGSAMTLVERSIYSGFYCFALNTYENGFLTRAEWELYQKWFAFLCSGGCRAPYGFIYLQTDPEIAFERTQKRSRSAESGVPLAYLEQIHQRHQDFLIAKKDVLVSVEQVPVLVLDCNIDFEADANQFARHADQVRAFVARVAAQQGAAHSAMAQRLI